MVSCKASQEFAGTTRASTAHLQNIWQSVITPNLVGHSNHSTSVASRTNNSSTRNLLHERSFSSDNIRMTGNEFIRKVKAYGKKQGVAVTLNASRGKGSHQTLYFGSAFTIVRNPKDELKTGTFHGMCSQLCIKPNDL